MPPESMESFLAVALGFAVAGLLSTLYQLLTLRPASFHLLQVAGAALPAVVPFLAFAAPFIIMRNTLQGQREEPRRLQSVMMATVVAAFWSLLSGTLVEMTVEALERLLA
jgi:polyferredoxin